MRRLDVDLDTWDPWTPADVALRLSGVSAPWYVLAGWALDLFLGEQTREHQDLEIGVAAERFDELRIPLQDLELVVVGGGAAWEATAEALLAYRQTWVREPGGPWRLDVIREEWDGEFWVCRRDPRIRLRGSDLIQYTLDRIPYARPEVALLFKAKATRPKDEADFARVLPELDRSSRAWLREALGLAHPGHPWLAELVS